jgi:Fe-S cluster assembly protein SufD
MQKVLTKTGTKNSALHARDSVRIIFSEKISFEEITVNENLIYILMPSEGSTGFPHIKFDLQSPNASLLFLAFITGKDKEQYTFETYASHHAQNTKSVFQIRAGMFDSSYVYHKGNINIEKGSYKSDANLHCKTLLLGERARGKMIPSLEIKENDVKAAHSATLGKVNKELLFYFKSRGIDANTAQKLIIRGFFEEQISMIPDKNLQEIVRKKIYERL